MEQSKRMHLFQGYGIELEYMIVNRDSLHIIPVADRLLSDATGDWCTEYNNGSITWSNELVNHVIELKCTQPMKDLAGLSQAFHENIQEINHMLKKYNARLMPTAAHPWMDPELETMLWPHGQSEIYEAYDRIFNCSGHGWSNLQSMHINLPFYDDEEFSSLHSVVRLLLPILPGLAASSPILDGADTGYKDKRLYYYQRNQRKVPSITGKTIPEDVHSKRQYVKTIYDKIEAEIRPLDPEGVLEATWLNSRGAIAKFDHGALEIRVLDIQESPQADLAIASFIIHVIKMMVKQRFSNQLNIDLSTSDLQTIFKDVVRHAEDSIITNADYLHLMGIEKSTITVKELWGHLYNEANELYPVQLEPFRDQIDMILKKGTLSTRILNAVEGQFAHTNLKLIYQELCEDLEENRQFEPCDQSILL